MGMVKINITDEYVGLSIKEFLKKNNVGRGKVESIRVNKESYVNDEYKPLEYILSLNDLLSFKFCEEIDFVTTDIPLEILYEDDYVLIVNKPANMIIHPDDKTKGGTLVNLVANYYRKTNQNYKVRYLHRIDKETTGIVLFAKDFLTEAMLLKDIQTHNVRRYYLALIEGKLSSKKGTIKANIGEDRHINNKMCVSKNGKEAITHYELMKEYDDFSLVKFILETGRTHQIRVHASYIKHPLLGDYLYGSTKEFSRVALHSYQIEFVNPITKKMINVVCNLPKDIISVAY